MRRLLIVVACLLAAACTTTNTKTAMSVSAPEAGAVILIVKPDVELSMLTAVGVSENRADWSLSAASSLQTALENQVKASSHTFRSVDPQEAMGDRTGQLMRLHEAVGASILVFEYGGLRLPTKLAGFDWTLGEGAQALAQEYGADYALFTFARGNYASSGRVATALVMAAVGVGVPMGGQQLFTSLVDLRTGQIIWFNFGVAGAHADMREVSGATTLMGEMFADAPL